MSVIWKCSRFFKITAFTSRVSLTHLHSIAGQRFIYSISVGVLHETERSVRHLPSRQRPLTASCYCTHSSDHSTPYKRDGERPVSSRLMLKKPVEGSPLSAPLANLEQFSRYRRTLKLADYEEVFRLAMNQEHITLVQAETLINIISNTALLLPKKRKVKDLKLVWQHVKKSGSRVERSLFEARNAAYLRLDALSELTVQDLRADMEKYKLSLKWTDYVTFLRIHCEVGDMAAANNLLESMVNQGHYRKAVHYNTLIRGHFIVGNVDTATTMYNSMEEFGFQKDTYTYGEMLLGYARSGDMHMMKKILADAEEAMMKIHSIFYMATMMALSETNRVDLANELLDIMPDSSLTLPTRGLIYEILEAGHLDLAIKTFVAITCGSGVVLDLVIALILSNVSTDDFVYCVESLKRQYPTYREITMLDYRSIVANLKCAERHIVYLDAMRRLGEPVKPHMYYPIINHYRGNDNLDGIISMIPRVLTKNAADMEDAVDFLYRILRKFDLRPNQIINLIQDNIPGHLKLPKTKTDLLMERGQSYSVPQKLIELTESLSASQFSSGDLHSLKARLNAKQRPPDITFASLKARLTKTDISQNANATYNTDWEYYKGNDSEMPTDHSSVHKLFGSLELYVQKNDIKRVKMVEEIIKKKELPIDSMRITMMMTEFHTEKTRDPDAAFHYLLACCRISPKENLDSYSHEAYRPDPVIPLKIVGLFVEKGMADSAIRVLNEVVVAKDPEWRHKTQYDSPIVMQMCSILKKCKTEEQARGILIASRKNGYINNPVVEEFAWRAYCCNIAKRGDGNEIVNAVSFLNTLPRKSMFLMGVNILLLELIHTINKEGIRQVMKSAKTCGHSDNAIQHVMAMAFMEAGKMDMAHGIVQLENFTASWDLIQQYYNYCVRSNQPELMEKLYDVMKDCTSVPTNEILFMCLRAYCNVTPQQIEKAQHFVTVTCVEKTLPVTKGMTKYLSKVVKNDKKSQPIQHREFDMFHCFSW